MDGTDPQSEVRAVWRKAGPALLPLATVSYSDPGYFPSGQALQLLQSLSNLSSKLLLSSTLVPLAHKNTERIFLEAFITNTLALASCMENHHGGNKSRGGSTAGPGEIATQQKGDSTTRTQGRIAAPVVV